jgi:hypothetical protein
MEIIVIVVTVMYVAVGFGGYWRALSLCKSSSEAFSVKKFKYYIILNGVYYAILVGKVRATMEKAKAINIEEKVTNIFINCFKEEYRLGAKVFVTYLLNPMQEER